MSCKISLLFVIIYMTSAFNINRLDITNDNEQDTNHKIKGINFGSNNNFGNKIKKDFYNGISSQTKSISKNDNGNYRNIQANGHNKNSEYSGDYLTKKKENNLTNKEKHFENLQNDISQSINSDKYYNKYNGESYKNKNNKNNKYGKYENNENNKKFDLDKYFKKYNGYDISEKNKVKNKGFGLLSKYGSDYGENKRKEMNKNGIDKKRNKIGFFARNYGSYKKPQFVSKYNRE